MRLPLLLLVLVILYLQHSTVDAIKKTRTVCEHQKATISCHRGFTIKILSAFYGRASKHICHSTKQPEGRCSAKRANHQVHKMCHGRRSCRVAASSRIFGDPCRNVRKYLRIRFECEFGDCRRIRHIQSQLLKEFKNSKRQERGKDERPDHERRNERHGDRRKRRHGRRDDRGREDERHGRGHERHGREHERHGREHERHGREHERHGREHERHGREHERHGREHERHGREYERQGRGHERHGRGHGWRYVRAEKKKSGKKMRREIMRKINQLRRRYRTCFDCSRGCRYLHYVESRFAKREQEMRQLMLGSPWRAQAAWKKQHGWRPSSKKGQQYIGVTASRWYLRRKLWYYRRHRKLIAAHLQRCLNACIY